MMQTRQEVFETVINHLLTQGKQSALDNGLCLYRSPEGLKCSVGCLITDEEYKQEMEISGGLRGLLDENILSIETKTLLTDHYSMLIKLQNLHDLYMTSDGFNDEFEMQLNGIKEKFNV